MLAVHQRICERAPGSWNGVVESLGERSNEYPAAEEGLEILSERIEVRNTIEKQGLGQSLFHPRLNLCRNPWARSERVLRIEERRVQFRWSQGEGSLLSYHPWILPSLRPAYVQLNVGHYNACTVLWQESFFAKKAARLYTIAAIEGKTLR